MEKNIYKTFFRGVAWSASMRWVMRGIGFINIIILARLLSPEAFGVVAMATIFIGFITSFTQMGAQQLLIREQEINPAMINTAWTILVLQGVLVALVLLAISPLAASYFREERLVAIIFVLSLSCIVDGFFNIGITLARKDLDFALDFRASVYTRLSSFFVTLLLVVLLRDYWALVYGRLLGSMMGVSISYIIHPYRPRFCLEYFRKFLTYSYAIIPLKISRYLNEKLDAIVVGGFASAATLGIYNIAGDLAKMFTNEIAAPLGRGLMPGYAKLASDPQALATAYGRVLSVASAIILPVGIGLCLVAEQLVPLLLGDQWLDAVSYVRFLSVYAALLSVQRLMSTQILIVSGHEARAAKLSWARAILLLVATVVAAKFYGPLGVAMICPVVGLVMLPVTVIVLTNSIPISIGNVVSSLRRPVLSVFVMAIVLSSMTGGLNGNAFISLFISVFSGALVYALAMGLSWYASGKPEGLEYLLEKAVRAKLVRG
jgi:lipopolysaccharide exporter